MVESRRQSGRLAQRPSKPLTKQNTGDTDSGDDSDGYESLLTELSDSDDDFGDRLRKSHRQPVKRVKTGTRILAKKVQKTTSKKSSDLSCIIDMPLDVLFEIFKWVDPRDLVVLSRTSQMLRNTLLSKKAITIWRAAFKETDTPACPSDFSEPRWANLLFGGNSCQVCQSRGIQRIDFGLRRRICSWCMKQKLVVTSRFSKEFPDFDTCIMELIPYTHTGGWYASSSRYYFREDIYDMVQELGTYQKNVQLRKPGAHQALDNFKKSRMEFVAKNMANVKSYDRWVDRTKMKTIKAKEDMKAKRYDAVKTRLMTMGYVEADIRCVKLLPSVHKDAELTNRGWSAIRNNVEEMVKVQRTARLARERISLIESRKRAIEQVYSAYKKTLVPSQWAYLPNVEYIYTFEGFVDLIEDPSDSKLEVHQFQKALQNLPGLVEARNNAKKATLSNLLPLVGGGGETSKRPDILDLATSVFQCKTSGCHSSLKPLIGWRRASCHSCINWYSWSTYRTLEPSYQFSKKGSQAVRALAALLKLNPLTALPEDLDGQLARFGCLDCASTHSSGYHGRTALTWRECVAHFIVKTQHTTPRWQLLTPDETVDVKARELSQSDPADDDCAWSCNRCPHFFESWSKRETVVEHLKKIHDVADPIEGADMFYDQRRGRTPRRPVFYGLKVTPVGNAGNPNPDPRATYKCKSCPPSKRTFELNGVKCHLKDKHKVLDPILGEHMECM